jgi:hypothetical protein
VATEEWMMAFWTKIGDALLNVDEIAGVKQNGNGVDVIFASGEKLHISDCKVDDFLEKIVGASKH